MGDRIVVVTGAASGIGREVARRFAAAEDLVVLLDRDEPNGRKALDGIAKQSPRSDFRRTDVTSSSSVAGTVSWIAEKFGGIDVVVNCAGILDLGTFEETEEEVWDRVISVNLKGPFLLIKAALPHMAGRANGRIINISSVAGRMGGLRTGPAYTASKAGLIGLTKSAARMAAKYGITANAVAPGTTNTEMARGFTKTDIDSLRSSMPLGRLLEPNEVAEAVFYLASEAAAMITGAVLDINGGMLMG